MSFEHTTLQEFTSWLHALKRDYRQSFICDNTESETWPATSTLGCRDYDRLRIRLFHHHLLGYHEVEPR